MMIESFLSKRFTSLVFILLSTVLLLPTIVKGTLRTPGLSTKGMPGSFNFLPGQLVGQGIMESDSELGLESSEEEEEEVEEVEEEKEDTSSAEEDMFLELEREDMISARVRPDPIGQTNPWAKDSKPEPSLSYFGGPIVERIKVFVIFWGGRQHVKFAKYYEEFYQGIVNSTYVDRMVEYSTENQTIHRGSYVGSYSYKFNETGNVRANRIRATLLTLISSGEVPPPDQDMYYAIHFRPNLTVTSYDGAKSCSYGGFCAYHDTARYRGSYAYYGVMPDFTGNLCETGCGKSSSQFRNQCATASHELIETVTDPMIGYATTYQAPLAWYDKNYGEVSDVCNQMQGRVRGGNGRVYTVQKNWSNKLKGCVGR